MKVKVTKEGGCGEKDFHIVWPDSQLEFHFGARDFHFNDVNEAVYILMDSARRWFYIGETGATKRGGVHNRFNTHKAKKEWDCALVIVDRTGDFKQDSLRRYFEWKLNCIAKEDKRCTVDSSAGEQNEMVEAQDRLSQILSVCRL